MGIGAAIGGIASAGSSLLGGLFRSNASEQASQQQAQASQMATMAQMQMFGQTRAALSPFMTAGANAAGALAPLIGTDPGGNPLTAPLTARFQPTMQQLEQTPGYQFTLGQGLKSVQNSYAAQGLGSSGAAIRGGTDYAEGLASTTYQQQLDAYLRNNLQTYNMLAGQAGQGLGAAGSLAGNSTAVGGQIGGNILAGGNALAAGTMGSANALAGGLTGAANAIPYFTMGGSGSALNSGLNYLSQGGGTQTPSYLSGWGGGSQPGWSDIAMPGWGGWGG